MKNNLIDYFNQAKEIFIDTMKFEKYKFKYLPQWTLFKAKQFYNEATDNNQRYFPKFKRGAIIYVKFGINIGSEMSGNHFAIVLDKYDKETKSTLTVVPLSSKFKSYYQELLPQDNVYFLNARYHSEQLKKLINNWEEKSKLYFSELDSTKSFYKEEFRKYITYVFLKNNGVITKELQEQIDKKANEYISLSLKK